MADGVLFRRGTGQVGTAGRAGSGAGSGACHGAKGCVASPERRLGHLGRHGPHQGVRQGGGLLQGKGSAWPWLDSGAEAAGLAFIGFSFLFPKSALKNGECTEPSDKQEQRLAIKRKNHKKNRNRNKSNTAPSKQVDSLVNASGVPTACWNF